MVANTFVMLDAVKRDCDEVLASPLPIKRAEKVEGLVKALEDLKELGEGNCNPRSVAEIASEALKDWREVQ